MDDSKRLEELLMRWADARMAGDPVSITEFCRSHPDLRAQLESHVLGIRQIEDMLGLPDDAEVVWPVPDSDPGEETADLPLGTSATTTILPLVPGYAVLERLGQGGMGVVYKALHLALNREVALKMIRRSDGITPVQLDRLRGEARLLALLSHRNVVPIYDVGEHDGRPYFSMELLPGGSLKDRISSRPLPPREAARLAVTLAEAVEFAHKRGLIHRDLKPANVLYDATGELKVTDFGLAKQIGDMSGQTGCGELVGTPMYMAPEQTEGQSDDLGPAVDTWALGVILYEMLTGRPPFMSDSVPGVLRQVVEAEPVPLRRLQSGVPKDLETICLKCLRKSPGDRYPSAGELAADLTRFLAGRPINARPIGPALRAYRWARRNPALAGSVGLIVLLLVGLGIEAAALMVNLEASRRHQAEAWAKEREARVAGALAESERAKADALAAIADNDRFHALLAGVRAREKLDRIDGRRESLDHIRAAAALRSAKDHQPELRSLAVTCLQRIDLEPVRELGQGITAGSIAFHPDGRWVALGDQKGWLPAVTLIDPVTGETVHTLSVPPDGRYLAESLRQDGIRSLAVSPDGRWLVGGSRGGMIHRWDLTADPPLLRPWGVHHDGAIESLAFSADGASLYSATVAELKRWSSEGEGDWPFAAVFRGGTKLRLLMPDPLGRWVGIANSEGAHFLDRLSLEPFATDRADDDPVAYGDPRALFLAHSRREHLELVAAPSAEPLQGVLLPAENRDSEARSVGLSPGGELIAVGFIDPHRLNLYETAGLRLAAQGRVGRDGGVSQVAFSPDGRHLAVTAVRATHLYRVVGADLQRFVGSGPAGIGDIDLSSDGGSLACYHVGTHPWSTAITRWDVSDGRTGLAESRRTPPVGDPYQVVLSSDGRSAAYVSSGALAVRWEGGSWQMPDTGPSEVNGVSFDSRGGLWLAEADAVSYRASPDALPKLPIRNNYLARQAGLGYKAVVPGSRVAVAARRDGHLFVVRADREGPVELPTKLGRIERLLLDEEADTALVGTETGSLAWVRLADGEVTRLIGQAHAEQVTGLASAEGRFLVSSSHDGTVKFWGRDGDEILSLRAPGPVAAARLSADGRVLAVLVLGERAVRLWDLERLRQHLRDLGIEPGF